MFAENYYKVRALRWGLTETPNGHPRFWMSFAILGIADPNDPAAPPKPAEPGTRTWSIAPTTEKSAEWLVRSVQAIGYDRPDLLGLDPEGKDAFNFEGREFLVQCKHREFNEQTREEWSVYVPHERPRLPAERLVTLNQLYGAKVKEAKERKAKAMATTTAAASGKELPY